MKSKIEIYADDLSPELQYTCDFIFGEFLGLSYEIITLRSAFSEDAVSISYGVHDRSADFHITPFAPFESLVSLPIERFRAFHWAQTPVFFGIEGSLPFDLFGAVFFLLARLDEYRGELLDKHGRFPQRSSVFAGTDLLEKPVVDHWLIKFGELLKGLNPDLKFKRRTFTWINTFDIDVAYAYRGRSFGRNTLAILKNVTEGDFRRIKERFNVLRGKHKDPFDTYDLQQSLHSLAHRNIYFFLNSSTSKFDRALPMKGALSDLIQSTKECAEVGIHPSYYSKDRPELIIQEKISLENKLGSPIVLSRQHYLRLDLPKTFNHLEKAGIIEEFSLGFAESLAFRCGTCTPFLFFDPIARSTSRIRIFPLSIMDATLRDYLNLNLIDALIAAKKMVDAVSAVNGSLITLWHNDTLSPSEYPSWHGVYKELAEYISEKSNGRII